MDYIYKLTAILGWDFGEEILKEIYFKEENKVYENVDCFKEKIEKKIKESCNCLSIQWDNIKPNQNKFNEDILILDEYKVYYRWEKHNKDCSVHNSNKECDCNNKRIFDNKYDYKIIVSKIKLN